MGQLRDGDFQRTFQKSLGSPQFLGVITTVTTGSQNNNGTAVPFSNTLTCLQGKILLIQTDIACYIRQGTTSAIAAVASATSASVALAAGERIILTMLDTEGFLACIGAAAVNLKVWELL